MRTISVKLPEDLVAKLATEARARRTTKSSLIRESLEASLRHRTRSRQSSCFDLASDLAGSLTGLPGDLAENPEYMKSFGE